MNTNVTSRQGLWMMHNPELLHRLPVRQRRIPLRRISATLFTVRHGPRLPCSSVRARAHAETRICLDGLMLFICSGWQMPRCTRLPAKGDRFREPAFARVTAQNLDQLLLMAGEKIEHELLLCCRVSGKSRETCWTERKKRRTMNRVNNLNFGNLKHL